MNWRKFVLLGCAVACVFAASIATAQMTGQGNSMSRVGMRGALTPRSIARMPERVTCESTLSRTGCWRRSQDAVIRVYDSAGNVIETHEHAGDFKEW